MNPAPPVIRYFLSIQIFSLDGISKNNNINVNSGEEEFFDVVCGFAAHNIKKFNLIFVIPN